MTPEDLQEVRKQAFKVLKTPGDWDATTLQLARAVIDLGDIIGELEYQLQFTLRIGGSLG